MSMGLQELAWARSSPPVWALVALCIALASGCDAQDKCGDGDRSTDDCHRSGVDASSDAEARLLDAQADSAATTLPDANVDASGKAMLDANVDARVLGDAERPLSEAGYRFVLENRASVPLYIQTTGFAGAAAFLSMFEDGRPVQFEPSCEVCLCSSCGNCGVCGRTVAQVARIEPGGTFTYTWPGAVWERVSMQCGGLNECERKLGVLAGEGAVEITYSESFRVETEFGAQDEFLVEPTRSVRASFQYVDGAEMAVALQ